MIGLLIKVEQDQLLICTPGRPPHEGYLLACGITSGHLSWDSDISCHLTKSPRPTSVTCLQPDSGDGTELWDTKNT